MKKTLRSLLVLMLLAIPTAMSCAQLLGGDPIPLCSPNDPACQTATPPAALSR